jgi:two-component system, LytTR family, sensor histidine kinase AgrC
MHIGGAFLTELAGVPIAISCAMLAFNIMMEYGTLTKRRPMAAHILTRFIAAVITLGIRVLWSGLGLGNTSFLLQGTTSLPFYFCCLYLFEESVAQKTFLYFMDYSATTFIASVCTWIAVMLPFHEREAMIQSALYIAMLLALVPLYFRFVRRSVQEMLFLFRKSAPFYAAFPVLSFFFFAVSFGPVNTPESLAWLANMALYLSVVVLAYYLLFSHFHMVYDRLRAEDQLTHAERQMSLQKKYFEEMDRGITSQRRMLHDMRHHLLAVATLATAKDCPAIEQYVERLLDSYEGATLKRYCGNAMVNAVISGYVKSADEKGIAVSTELGIPESIGIDDYELCTLFGNTIENAIEACDRIPAGAELYKRRYIDIKSRAERGRLLVRIENSFIEDPKRRDPGFKSSKGSGIGLESVRRVTELYQGNMNCERSGNVFVFSAVLCLRP